jgi:hypothetical protein
MSKGSNAAPAVQDSWAPPGSGGHVELVIHGVELTEQTLWQNFTALPVIFAAILVIFAVLSGFGQLPMSFPLISASLHLEISLDAVFAILAAAFPSLLEHLSSKLESASEYPAEPTVKTIASAVATKMR